MIEDNEGNKEGNTEDSVLGDHEVSADRMLYGLNLVQTKMDSTVRRGAIVKSMAIFSRYHFTDVRSNYIKPTHSKFALIIKI